MEVNINNLIKSYGAKTAVSIPELSLSHNWWVITAQVKQHSLDCLPIW